MTKIYRSKVDKWLMGILIAAMIVSIFGAVSTIAAGISFTPAFALFAIVPLLVGVGLPLWVLTSTYYTLTDELLTVKSAFFSWRINVSEIHTVAPTSNPLSSPALSLDRLRIEYGNGRSLMISPEDKEEFIRDLRSRPDFSGSA